MLKCRHGFFRCKEYITRLVKCHKILKYLQQFVMSHDMSKKVIETKPWNIKKAVCVLENSWKVLDSLWCPFNILLLSSWARFEFLLSWNLKDFFELCRLGRKLIQLISPFWELSSSVITLETFNVLLVLCHVEFLVDGPCHVLFPRELKQPSFGGYFRGLCGARGFCTQYYGPSHICSHLLRSLSVADGWNLVCYTKYQRCSEVRTSLPSNHFICFFLVFYPQHYARMNCYVYHIDLSSSW